MKNRKKAIQNIDGELASDLRAMLGGKLPNAMAFKLPSETNVARMLKKDLRAARELWLHEVRDAKVRLHRLKSDFLRATDAAGKHLDFTAYVILAVRGSHSRACSLR